MGRAGCQGHSGRVWETDTLGKSKEGDARALGWAASFAASVRVPTCSCPRMSTPPGLMGCQGARFSPVPSFSPSWNASHMPSRVVQVMQIWCHLPSLTNRGSCATCGDQHAGETRQVWVPWDPPGKECHRLLLSTAQDSRWDSLPCLRSDTSNPTWLAKPQDNGHSWFWAWLLTPMLAWALCGTRQAALRDLCVCRSLASVKGRAGGLYMHVCVSIVHECAHTDPTLNYRQAPDARELRSVLLLLLVS